MDIDQIITNNVDDILTFYLSGNTIGTYRSWWISKLNSDKSINTSYGNHNIPLNGGFYKFKSGELSYVWDRFIEMQTIGKNIITNQALYMIILW